MMSKDTLLGADADPHRADAGADAEVRGEAPVHGRRLHGSVGGRVFRFAVVERAFMFVEYMPLASAEICPHIILN